MSTGLLPNMLAVINKLANGNPTLQQQLTDYSKQCVKPGHEHFIDEFEGELKPACKLLEFKPL